MINTIEKRIQFNYHINATVGNHSYNELYIAYTQKQAIHLFYNEHDKAVKVRNVRLIGVYRHQMYDDIKETIETLGVTLTDVKIRVVSKFYEENHLVEAESPEDFLNYFQLKRDIEKYMYGEHTHTYRITEDSEAHFKLTIIGVKDCDMELFNKYSKNKAVNKLPNKVN